MRREVVGETGLFDEALGPGTPARSGDDHEFFYRVMARGYRIVYDPAAVVWHRHRRDWKALRNMMHGYGVGLFAWWTRALLIEREFTFLKLAPLWFLQHHVKNLAKALLRSNAKTPPDIAFAEFVGALAGPASYLKGRFLAWRYRAFEAQPVVEENRAFLAELSNDTTSSAGG
jgi:GT2 family glycosyltransferase